MPGSFKTECVSFVAKYIPEILQLVGKGMTPAQFCEMIKLCTATSSVKHGGQHPKVHHRHSHAHVATRNVEQHHQSEGQLVVDDKCQACEVLISLANSLRKKGLTVPHITNGLVEFCGAFPEQDKSVCIYNVNTHTEDVVKMLNEGQSVQDVCKYFKACLTSETYHKEATNEKVGPFLMTQCNQGPSFWCASRSNAALCGAIKYCASKGLKP